MQNKTLQNLFDETQQFIVENVKNQQSQRNLIDKLSELQKYLSEREIEKFFTSNCISLQDLQEREGQIDSLKQKLIQYCNEDTKLINNKQNNRPISSKIQISNNNDQVKDILQCIKVENQKFIQNLEDKIKKIEFQHNNQQQKNLKLCNFQYKNIPLQCTSRQNEQKQQKQNTTISDQEYVDIDWSNSEEEDAKIEENLIEFDVLYKVSDQKNHMINSDYIDLQEQILEKIITQNNKQNFQVVGFYGIKNNIEKKINEIYEQKIALNDIKYQQGQWEMSRESDKFQNKIYIAQKNKHIIITFFTTSMLIGQNKNNHFYLYLLRLFCDLCHIIYICCSNISNTQDQKQNSVSTNPICFQTSQQQRLSIYKMICDNQNLKQEYIQAIFSNSIFLALTKYTNQKNKKQITANKFCYHLASFKYIKKGYQKITYDYARFYFIEHTNHILSDQDNYKKCSYIAKQFRQFLDQKDHEQYDQYTKQVLDIIYYYVYDYKKEQPKDDKKDKFEKYQIIMHKRYYQIFLKNLDMYIKKQDFNVNYQQLYKPIIQFKIWNISLSKGQQKDDNNIEIERFKTKKNFNQFTYESQQGNVGKNVKVRQVVFLTQDQGIIFVDELEDQKLVLLKIQRKNVNDKFKIDILKSYPKEVKIFVNKIDRCMIIWNNKEQTIKKVKFLNDNLDTGNERILHIYGTHNKINITQIKSLIYCKNNVLYLIDQNKDIHSYNLNQECMKAVNSILEIEEIEQIEQEIAIEKPKTQVKYEKFLYSENENYILLQCQDSIDIYNSDFRRMQSIKIQNGFQDGQMIKIEQNYYICVNYVNNLEIYKIKERRCQQKILFEKNHYKCFIEQKLIKKLHESQIVYGNKIIITKKTPNKDIDVNNQIHQKDFVSKDTKKYYGKNDSQNQSSSSSFFDFEEHQKQYLIVQNQSRDAINELSKKLQFQNLEIVQNTNRIQNFFYSVGNFKFLVKTRLPIYIAQIKQSRLIPLINGNLNHDFINQQDIKELEQDKEKLFKCISKKIEFGPYEDILQNWQGDIKVISIIGPQNMSQCYLFNRIFGTRFNTEIDMLIDGIWMSLSILQEEDKKQVLYVLFYCNGLQSPRRNLAEQINLALFAFSISDLVILNVQNIANLNFEEFFKEFTVFTKNLNNKNLFQSKLLILKKCIEQQAKLNVYNDIQEQIEHLLVDFGQQIEILLEVKQIFVQLIEDRNSEHFEQSISHLKNIFAQCTSHNRYIDGRQFLTCLKSVISALYLKFGIDQKIVAS